MEPASFGFAIYGAANASIALLDKICYSVAILRERWKNSKDVTEKLDQLKELASKIEALGRGVRRNWKVVLNLRSDPSQVV